MTSADVVIICPNNINWTNQIPEMLAHFLLGGALQHTNCHDPKGKCGKRGPSCHHSHILLMEEILHQLISGLSHYLQGFIHPRWCRISSINSMSHLWRFMGTSGSLIWDTMHRAQNCRKFTGQIDRGGFWDTPFLRLI